MNVSKYFILGFIVLVNSIVFSQYESENVTLLGRIGDGRSYGQLIENNIAYLGGGSYLYILDVSDNTNPKLISKMITTSVVGEIKKRDNYLFVAHASDGLTIFDVSDLQSPKIVGNCKTRTTSNGLSLYNDFVFLSDVYHGFIVIDISDVSNPFEIADYYSEGWAEGTEIKDNLLYYCDNYAGLKIFNISDPSNPLLLKKYTNIPSAENIIFYKDYDIVLSQSEGGMLYILNSTNLDNIIEVSKLAVNGASRQITLDGDKLYIGGVYTNLKIIDISVISEPSIVFTYDFSLYTRSIASVGNTLFILNVDTGLEIYNKKSVNTLLSKYFLPSHMREFDFYDNYIAIAYQYAGVRLYDISNPNKPEYITNLIGDNYPSYVYKQRVSNVINIDNISFMFTDSDGVHLIDIQDPNNPVFLSRLQNNNGSNILGSGVARIKNDIFYIVGGSAINVFNLEDFANPILLQTIDVQYPQRILVKDNYAYITSWNPQGNYSLLIYNVADAQHPTLEGKIELQFHPYGIDITENYIFMACMDGGLYILDVTNKTTPVIKEIIYSGNHQMSYVSIDRNYAYVTDGINGLLVFDISSIDSIKKVGSINFNYNGTYFVKAYRNEIYVSSFSSGLFILKNDLITSLLEIEDGTIVGSLNLFQNYPNPFNPTTTISFELPQRDYVSLEIFNTLGEKVSSHVNKELDAGSHKINFDASSLPSGVYIYRIATKRNSVSKKMTLVK